jgi:phosphoribosylaminoimidazole-succinocarboxamide synthase
METRAYHQVTLEKVPLMRRGKVRDIFDLGDRLLMAASDRISAFDVVLPNAIPYKGIVLNSISSYWFHRTNHIVSNHMITDRVEEFDLDITEQERDMLRGRSMLVEKGDMVEVECVVRGYLDGSGWRSYRDTGKLFDIDLPSGLKQGDKLYEPLFTPTTKATCGQDEYIGFQAMQDELGTDLAEKLKRISMELYDAACQEVYEKGLIL